MAEGRRRGGEPDDRDDALPDDELIDELDEEFDDDEDEEVVDADETPRRGGRTATKARTKPTEPSGRAATRRKAGERQPNIFARLVNFVREVVAELRKVIWPTRKELLTYTAVVVVFVVIMVSIVGLLDYGFAKLVLAVFGNKTSPADGE